MRGEGVTPPDRLARAVELLASAARPRRIILFGSAARGDAGPDSDLDFLVVQDEVPAPRAEVARLSLLLAEERIPADVIVASEALYQAWKDQPGSVIYDAHLEGRAVYLAPGSR